MAIRKLRCKVEDDHTHIPTENSDESGEAPVFACKFAQTAGNEHILALANEEGQIAIHNTEHNVNGEADCYGKTAHYNAIFDLAWMVGQMKLVSVSGDHTARLFDVSRSDIMEERIFHGHTRSVKTVAFRKDDPAVFATGARDGAIFVWDTRANFNLSYITQPDRIISNSHNIPNTPGSGSKFKKRLVPLVTNVSGANSVTGLVFQNDMSLISCGAGDGAIKVWDLRKNYGVNKREPLPKCVLPYTGTTTRNGFTNLLVDRSGIRLYANCMDNTIYCYNISTYQPQPIMMYTGHHNSSFYVKSSLSADGNYLLSGSSDQNAYIWNTNKSTPLVSLVGHSAEVTCVAWCQKGGIKLVTCSDDMKHKIWQVYDEESCDNWEIKGRGSAVEVRDKETTKIFGTPSSRKRTLITTPHSQRKRSRICERCQNLTPGSFESLKLNCENCLFSVSRSSKRTSSQAELSSPGNTAKKQQTEKGGARRLFGSLQEATTSKDGDGVLATILEETSPVKTNDNSDYFSPTANLPNFVIDGEAPHLKNFSPQKKQDKDWLTKMRIEQSLRTQMEILSRPSSPKQLRLSLIENSIVTSPKINNSGKKQKKITTSRAQSPLLKFFRVTNNSRSCERQCNGSMSPIINTGISTELR